MSSPRKKISICIPAYNESQNLPHAIQAVEVLFQKNLPQYDLELIVTDNASTDSTWETLQKLAESRPYLKAYRFSRNFGYQNSVFAGLYQSTGDAVVELDADLEDPPAVIEKFIHHWEQGYEVVYGVRSKRHAPWIMKLFFSAFYLLLNRLSELKIPQNSGDFRLLDRKVVQVLKALPERNLFLRGLVSYLGFKQIPVIYERDPRLSGKSKFRFFHYLVLALDALTAFSKSPLRLIGVAGAILFLGSTGLAGYYLICRIIDGTPMPGFTTLAILVLLMNSITYIFLGILGEYLSRIFDDSKFRPRVIFRDAIHDSQLPPYI